MSDFMNYQFQDPMQTFMKMSQFGSMMAQQQAAGANAQAQVQEAQAKLAAAQVQAETDALRQEQIGAAIEKLRQPGATYQDYLQLSLLLPKEQADAMRDAAKQMKADEQTAALNETGQIFAAFQANRPDMAAKLLRQQADAERAAGNENGAQMAEEWIRTIEAGDPEDIADLGHMFGVQLMLVPGGDKVVENTLKMWEERRAAAAEPDAIKKRLADLNFTEAQTNKVNVEARKLGLEADKLAQEIEDAKKALPPGIKLSEPAEKLVNDSVIAATKSNALAAQYATLADDFDTEIKNAGTGARVSELVARLGGTEKNPTALRQEYMRLRNTAVIKMLPPGIASDKDVEIAMQAFPIETSSPANIARFLRGMAKLQKYEAKVSNAQAEWIQQNGNLGTAQTTINVGDKPVKAGTRFADFVAAYIPDTSVLGMKDGPRDQPVEEVDL